MQKQDSQVESVINTTIGDLIEAVLQVALEAGKTQQEGYQLAALTLESILNRKQKTTKPLH